MEQNGLSPNSSAELQDTLQPEADNATKIADLEKTIEDKDVEIGLLNETILKNEETICNLNEQLSKKPAKADDPITFEYNGKPYQVLGGTAIPSLNQGQKMTALEIATSEEAQAWLVEKQSGHIRELK